MGILLRAARGELKNKTKYHEIDMQGVLSVLGDKPNKETLSERIKLQYPCLHISLIEREGKKGMKLRLLSNYEKKCKKKVSWDVYSIYIHGYLLPWIST